MANSYEIAQMFSQQNQMFMGQNQFASSIGVPSPPVMNQVGMGGPGIGAYGNMGSPRGGQFSFGQSPMLGYGAGNAIAGGAMSAMGGAFSGGSMALGAMSSMGMLGKAGALMDPIAMGAGAMRFGTSLGMGAMGAGAMGAAAFAAPMAIGMGISHGVQSFVNGGQQQAQMNTMLGNQYQFFNPSSRSGQGFSRDDAKSIGDMTRQMAHLPEMMTSFDELSRIMGRMKSNGAMSGARTATDFQARFREAIGTIRDTAKILGSTMEEAEQFFSASRGSGFYGRQAQLKNALSAQFTSGVTGASMGQVAGLQSAGADMAMSFGARRGLGATAVTNMAQNIGLAQASGRFREGAVEDVTGLQGPEANLALAQKMFGGMMRFGQTAPGRLAMAGMMKFENGKAVGVDEDLAKKFNQGMISIDELKSRAGRLTDKEKISFTARQSDLVASLAGQIGPGGAFQMMQGALGGRGDEATNLVMQRLTGMSAGELDIAQGMSGVSGDGQQGLMAKFRQKESNLKERTDPKAILQRIKTRMHAATFGKLEQLGADVQNSIAKSIDGFVDDLVGRSVVTITEDRAKAVMQAFGGTGSSEAREMLKAASGLRNMDPSKLKQLAAQGKVSGSTQTMLNLGLGPLGGAIAGTMMGGESGAARFIAGLSGQMTTGQGNELAAKVFGSSDIAKQSSMAAKFQSGNVAGSGAERAVAEIIAKGGFEGKSSAQRLQALSAGLEERTLDAAKKMGINNLASIRAMRSESIDNQPNLTKDDKKLLKSYIAATESRSGGDVFSQMAAASGAGGVVNFAEMAGGGSNAEMQKAAEGLVKSSRQALIDTLGEGGAGLVENSKGAGKALSAAFKDSRILSAIQSGDASTAVKLLKQAGADVDAKDIPALREAVNGALQKNQGTDSDAIAKKIADASDRMEMGKGFSQSTEAAERIAKYGAELGAAAGGGAAGEKQKALADAMMGIKTAGDLSDEGKRQRVTSAAAAYSSTLKGLKGQALEDALAAGGPAARALLNSDEFLTQKLGRGVSGGAEEIAKMTGLGLSDVQEVVGKGRGKLTKDQIAELVKRSQGVTAIGAILGGDGAGPTKNPTDRLIDTLTKIDGNMMGIATAVAVMNKNPEAQALLLKQMTAGKENNNSGHGGQTTHTGDTK